MGCLDQVCKCKTRLSLMRLGALDFSPSACYIVIFFSAFFNILEIL